MDQKFSKLRLKEFAKVAAVGALALHAVEVGAAPGAHVINAGNAVWHLNANIVFATTSSGWGFSEGSLHTHSGIRHDAFDGALSWHVNPSAPANLSAGGYVSPGGIVDISTDPAGGVTALGTTQVLAGLNVTGQIYFSPVKAVARSVLILQNPTGAPITVTVDNDTNRGSDSNTYYQLTSSGDQTVDSSDNWFVSSQRASPTIADDPILTFAYQQAGAAARGSPIVPAVNGSDKFYERYTVTVPANATRRLMVFVQMSDTVANAENDATVFNTNASLQASDYLTGLSAADQSEIVNWNGLGPTAAVPTLSEWALLGTAGLLGLAGLGSIWFIGRRRNRTAYPT